MAKRKKTGTGKAAKRRLATKSGKKKKLTRPPAGKAAGRKSAAKTRARTSRMTAKTSTKAKRAAKGAARTGRSGKKKPTEKSAKKKAAKKKPAAPGRRSTLKALARSTTAPPVPETPRPIVIPGAWPFPVGPRA